MGVLKKIGDNNGRQNLRKDSRLAENAETLRRRERQMSAYCPAYNERSVYYSLDIKKSI
jgi:hypothetical protein